MTDTYKVFYVPETEEWSLWKGRKEIEDYTVKSKAVKAGEERAEEANGKLVIEKKDGSKDKEINYRENQTISEKEENKILGTTNEVVGKSDLNLKQEV